MVWMTEGRRMGWAEEEGRYEGSGRVEGRRGRSGWRRGGVQPLMLTPQQKT
jgi:hypothetical protein